MKLLRLDKFKKQISSYSSKFKGMVLRNSSALRGDLIAEGIAMVKRKHVARLKSREI